MGLLSRTLLLSSTLLLSTMLLPLILLSTLYLVQSGTPRYYQYLPALPYSYFQHMDRVQGPNMGQSDNDADDATEMSKRDEIQVPKMRYYQDSCISNMQTLLARGTVTIVVLLVSQI